MGLSVSKSMAYTGMKNKWKDRQNSKQKAPKEIARPIVEEQEFRKKSEGRISSSLPHKIYPITELPKTSKKSINLPANVDSDLNQKSPNQLVEESGHHSKPLTNLQKSLKSPQRSTQDDNATQQFAKTQTFLKKHSKTPSCFSVRLRKEVDGSVPVSRTMISSSSIRAETQKKVGAIGQNNDDDELSWNGERILVEENCIKNKDYRNVVEHKNMMLSNKFGQADMHLNQKQNQEQIKVRFLPCKFHFQEIHCRSS